jgi:hypothetical protein
MLAVLVNPTRRGVPDKRGNGLQSEPAYKGRCSGVFRRLGLQIGPNKSNILSMEAMACCRSCLPLARQR